MKEHINNDTPQPLYINKHGSIYEGDIVECFDIVAIQIRITKETKLTKKMIGNARVVKTDNNLTQK